MEISRPMYDEQAALWNGLAGRAWVGQQLLLEAAFKGLEDLLVDQVSGGPGDRVLDVGCGTGSTTLAIERALGARGHHVGVDVSEPMIAAARSRAEAAGSRAEFIVADAQTYPFEDGAFDIIVSRFGVMFFDDPVRAFANIERAARRGAALKAIVWRAADANPFMTTAERAAATVLGGVPARPARGPGQFAFADRDHVREILEAAGWESVSCQAADVLCRFPEEKLVDWVTKLGPVGRMLHGLDDQARDRVLGAVLPAFSGYVHAGEVRFDAACWMLSARARDEEVR
jgi:SAM-dependent methyltransferase